MTTTPSSQPTLKPSLTEGCAHQDAAAAEKRWLAVEQMIARTPEDDRDAQWSSIAFCSCCGGTAKGRLEPRDGVHIGTNVRCSRCES